MTTLTQDLNDAVAANDVEDIAAVLDRAGVAYTIDDSVPAYPRLEIQDFGGIWYDDGHQSANPGWVWESLERDESDAIGSLALRDDLLEVVDNLQ